MSQGPLPSVELSDLEPESPEPAWIPGLSIHDEHLVQLVAGQDAEVAHVLELADEASADQVLRAIKASTGGRAGGSTKEQQALVWLLEVLAAQGSAQS